MKTTELELYRKINVWKILFNLFFAKNRFVKSFDGFWWCFWIWMRFAWISIVELDLWLAKNVDAFWLAETPSSEFFWSLNGVRLSDDHLARITARGSIEPTTILTMHPSLEFDNRAWMSLRWSDRNFFNFVTFKVVTITVTRKAVQKYVL